MLGFPDPRILYIGRKFSILKSVLAFVSAKGGVGKSTLSALFSTSLESKGFSVGLVDLDLTNPNLHLILGVDLSRVDIVEERGVKPLNVGGFKFFSPAMFTRGDPLPLKGRYVLEALREILTMVNLSSVEVLILDMPPGVKEEFFEISWLSMVKNIIVSTQDILGVKSSLRLARLLRDEGVREIALIENMALKPQPVLESETKNLNIIHLGILPYDPEFKSALGDLNALKSTHLYRTVEEATNRLIKLLNI